ncbi:hypothetical protein CC86DRAFT_126834 [Ophiobolus disseminans]|uniref:Uncharacterized protein n=1 Tax=Ophiobolus disseminans TaxID=1469910 RepID=A0A6A6ZHC3_9PLEO|nr:hypothetical protein CC86DRAFT_126834 [Ophiobolus disseminans]
MVIVLEQLNGALAGGIGLVSETIAAYRKQEGSVVVSPVQSSEPSPPNPETDEDQWELDQVGHDLRRASADGEQKIIRNPSRQAEEFLKRHPLPVLSSGGPPITGRLPHPVIIPQRRPGDRLRGFVRAYAPDLMNCGIDQETWMDLLVTFTRASRAPKWMAALNLAGVAGFAIPAHAAGAGVGIAVQIITAIAMELKGRIQSNNFLKQLNEGFFRPRGLYCLVMSFDNTHKTTLTEEDLVQNANLVSTTKTGLKKYTNKIRASDGLSGPVDFPNAAPLVSPGLDWLAENGNADQKKKLQGSTKFCKIVADYYDRRAQADYAFKNPASPLAVAPTRGFASKYGDPSDATNLSPLSLATYGFIPYSRSTYIKRSRGGNRKIKDKVLYLIVISMPSDEDLERAEGSETNF